MNCLLTIAILLSASAANAFTDIRPIYQCSSENSSLYSAVVYSNNSVSAVFEGNDFFFKVRPSVGHNRAFGTWSSTDLKIKLIIYYPAPYAGLQDSLKGIITKESKSKNLVCYPTGY